MAIYEIKSTLSWVPTQSVQFEGVQETGFPDMPNFPLYTLSISLYRHPVGSTVSRQTLEKDFGYIFSEEMP